MNLYRTVRHRQWENMIHRRDSRTPLEEMSCQEILQTSAEKYMALYFQCYFHHGEFIPRKIQD